MIKTNRLYPIAAFLLAASIALSFLLGSGGGLYAAAASDVVSTYEGQNVLDDLQGATIDGEKIDLSEYYFDKGKNVKVLSFVEFGYSFNTGNQDDYGLYVYVYNPRGLDFTQNQSLNKIQFRTIGKDTSTLEKYRLNYLNRSTKKGYEGLFYKFKIALTSEQRSAILNNLDSTERKYDVTGIELCSAGNINATDYDVANVYTYTGYAAGYGSDFDTEESTLACTSKDSLTLSLDVHSTWYRPEGTNGKDNYTQDVLQSVYFSIPNSYINEYGRLTEVHAQWLNAVTVPFLITGNNEIYKKLKEYVGQDIGGYAGGNANKNVGYAIYGAYRTEGGGTYQFAELAYNNLNAVNDARMISQLNGVFFAPGGNDAADKYTLPSEELLKWFSEFSERFSGDTGELVNGKYSPLLFDSVDEKFTEMHISADENRSLTSEKISQHWWQKIFGGSYVESHETYENIEAIHEVTDSDFEGNDSEAICNKLYISTTEYSDFKSYYNKSTKEHKTVFLLRYQVNDYKAWEATEREYYERSTIIIGDPTDERTVDTNAYFFQATANLDFDIIDVTLTKDDVSTIIACVSSPIDIVPDITPPVNTTPDGGCRKVDWQKIIAFLGILFIVFIGFRFFQWLAGGSKKGK